MGDRVILHSDINSCYASIELLHHPELRGKPLAVGGDPEARHGIVLTADYVAKKHGVKTGMALWQARQVCPDITFVPLRMDLYLRFSKMAHEIYGEYTDLQEPYGIDESWLDVTASASIKGDGYKIAHEISNRMKSELGITVSVGVSFNKIFAKLGSDYKKPDAITTMYKDEFQTKAWKLPASDLLYVGRSTDSKLRKMGIHTIGDIARADEKWLNSYLGKMGSILWAFANGYDTSPVRKENTSAPVKSIGNSTTTPRDLENDEDVKIVLYVLAESVAARLRENGFRCRTVEISIRDNELYSYTKQTKVSNATNITKEIADAGFRLFKQSYNWQKPIRSVGIRGADLVNDNYWEQLDLFHNAELRDKMMKMDAAVDDMQKRTKVTCSKYSSGKDYSVIICPYCGLRLRNGNKKDKYMYCSTGRMNRNSPCSNVRIEKERVQNVLVTLVRNQAKMMLTAEDLLRQKSKNLEPKRNTDSLIKKLKAEQKRLETKKVSDYEKYKQGSISRSDFVEAKKSLDQHISEIEKELLALDKEMLKKSDDISDGSDIWDIKKYVNLDKYDKEIMASLIEKAIVVDENTVQVTWKNQDMYDKILSKL